MYKLDAARLSKANIILTRDKASPTSWLVRGATRSPYSHAILYVGGHSFIDSDMNGVHSNNLQRLIFRRCSDVRVFRLKEPASQDQVDAICDFARAEVGQHYAVREAALAARGSNMSSVSKRQFCSRLVAQAYRSQGLLLGVDADRCLPGDFIGLAGLVEIEDLCIPASAEEVAFAKDVDNPLRWQEEITNRLNAGIRRHTGAEVATLQDWAQLALTRPDLDATLAWLLEDSRYLEMWRWDMERCPHWYDLAAFRRAVPAEARTKVATEQLNVERDNLRRFQITLSALEQAQASSPRATLRLLIDLYDRLIQLSGQRTGILIAARDNMVPTLA